MKLIDLIKPPTDSVRKERKNTVLALSEKELIVGGNEGRKSQILIQPLEKQEKIFQFLYKKLKKKIGAILSGRSYQEIKYRSREKEFNSLVIKEYDLGYIDTVKDIIRSYKLLLKMGYPVPVTARYFLGGEYKLYLAMSDMTQGGKYRMWGWSNNMTFAQSKELKQMQLSQADVLEIKNQLNLLILKANEELVELQAYYFHIRQEKKTRKLDIVLLDVDTPGDLFKTPESFWPYTNEFVQNRWLDIFSKALNL